MGRSAMVEIGVVACECEAIPLPSRALRCSGWRSEGLRVARQSSLRGRRRSRLVRSLLSDFWWRAAFWRQFGGSRLGYCGRYLDVLLFSYASCRLFSASKEEHQAQRGILRRRLHNCVTVALQLLHSRLITSHHASAEDCVGLAFH